MKAKKSILLLLIALFGLTIPNGLFLYWLIYEYEGLASLLRNKLAIAFILDAFLVLGLLSYSLVGQREGKIKWYWFVVLSLIGGLGFSLPFYWVLNDRIESE